MAFTDAGNGYGILVADTTPTGAAGVVLNDNFNAIDDQLALLAPLTSAVLVTPNLGTPSAGVLTNCTGTAAGLTAGAVTTNANLTGHVTSTGNAAILGSFTVSQLSTALSDATISGNNSGDQTITGQQTVWLPAGAMTARTTSGAASGSVETTTNKVMIETLDFDSAADEFAQFAIQMPKGWDEGTILFQPIWSHAATTTNFGVAWGLQAVALANDDALDTAFGTGIVVTDTGGTTDDLYIAAESAAVTVAGSPGAEEWVVFQIYRDVSDAADDMAIDARLHGIKIHYTTDAATDD